MSNLPNSHNPENATPTPGYRWLNPDEPRKKGDQFLTTSGQWLTPTDMQEGAPAYDARWTYRRALNVDDPSAPPPEVWQKSVDAGYEVIKGPIEGAKGCRIMPDLEMWDSDANTWNGSVSGGNERFYYRRLISPAKSSVPSTQSTMSTKITLKPGQSIVVNVHQNEALSRAVQEIAFAAGWEWWWNKDSRSYFAGKGDQKVGYIYIDEGHRLSWDSKFITGRSDGVHLDARTDLGTLIDLLAAPAIVAPKIRGSYGKDYEAKYAKGDDVVVFGCAKIDVCILRNAAKAMGCVVPDNGTIMENAGICLNGNRCVRAIELDSGVKLTKGDIKVILDYVDAVNKAS